MAGHSTEVHQAVSPAPQETAVLKHIEAMPHRGGIKVHAHTMEGGMSSHHEHIAPHMAAAHEIMGKYMVQGEPASVEHEGEPQQQDRQESQQEFERDDEQA